jgi:hypothetical protein
MEVAILEHSKCVRLLHSPLIYEGPEMRVYGGG